MKDYYGILEIKEESTQNEIKQSYRRLAFKWHPDKNPGNDTTKKMQEIIEANLILSNPEKRKRYDKHWHYYYGNKTGSNISNISNTSNTSKNRATYNTDETLFDWMHSAQTKSENLVKETLEDLLGMLNAAGKAAKEEAKKVFVYWIIFAIIGLFFFIIARIAI